jgi:Fe-S-cluster containining protein
MPSDSPISTNIFACRKCGDCCKGFGGTYLSNADIAKIADFIGICPETFVSTYCRMSGNRPLLAQKANGYCVFWDRICTIHPVKPRMCRQWPYIESVLRETENWRIMGSMCPGIQSEAPEEIVRQRVREKLQDKSSRDEE